MREGIQRFGFDPLLAAVFLAFAMAAAAALVLLCDRIGGRLAQIVQPSSSKLPALEGLRGILAVAVVAHHACCWYFFTQSGVWSTGPNVVFDRLASFGVAQFFYLSGFLFWRKLMRRGHIPAGKFYLSRFIRIAPVYYIAIGAALLLGLAVNGFNVHVGAGGLIASLLQWILFSLGGQPAVNHADIARITCGVTWTLALEWLFYLSLPFLGWFARKTWRLVVYALARAALFLLARYMREAGPNASAIFSAAAITAQYAKFMLVGFGGGILIAAFEQELRAWLRTLGPARNWIVLALFLAYLTIPGLPDAAQVLLLAAFALIVAGADLFGLLVGRSARLLGAISYPVYLVHGLVYYVTMRLRGGFHSVNLLTYLAESALCLVSVLLLAVVLHVVVERPTMRLAEAMAPTAAAAQSARP